MLFGQSSPRAAEDQAGARRQALLTPSRLGVALGPEGEDLYPGLGEEHVHEDRVRLVERLVLASKERGARERSEVSDCARKLVGGRKQVGGLERARRG